MPTLTLRPNGNSGTPQWTPSGAASNWDCVNDTVFDDFTTYILHSVPPGGGIASAIDRYTSTYTPPGDFTSGSTISDVTIYVRAGYNLIDDAATIYLGCRNSGTDYYDAGYSTPSFDSWVRSMATRPWGGAWTKADIDVFVFALKSTLVSFTAESDGSENDCSQIYAVVTYEAGSTETTLIGAKGSITLTGKTSTLVASGGYEMPSGSIILRGQPSLLIQEVAGGDAFVFRPRKPFSDPRRGG